MGKPEPLKHSLAGFWSRRITSEHRMVFLGHHGRSNPKSYVPLSLLDLRCRTLVPRIAVLNVPINNAPGDLLIL
ncbi:hypothetical protein E0L16_15905 [Enterobacter quasihormaechei]|uniref:Uncharacterized protein n=1 Tax=Enterobacter quasihormaechei TaxID=2529382 RepID=A0AAE8QUY8_9ENTR|nr:hypothetical protein E0L16_15905 [Enterobacter quasihormaechei]